MATTKTPTFQQIVTFVKENQLNVFNEPNPLTCDNDEFVFNAEDYTEENFDDLVLMWQRSTPCSLTVDEIQKIYDRAFAKLQTIKGKPEFFDYAINVCQRLLNYKYKKICSSH
jgi:hypothetical protein